MNNEAIQTFAFPFNASFSNDPSGIKERSNENASSHDSSCYQNIFYLDEDQLETDVSKKEKTLRYSAGQPIPNKYYFRKQLIKE